VILRGEFVGAPLTLGDAAALVARRTPLLLACVVLCGLMAFAGFVACFLPYFFVLWRTSTAPLACVAERLGPIEAIQRSFELTKKSFLRWAGVFVVASLIVTPLSVLANVGAQASIRDAALENLPLSTGGYAVVLWLTSALFLAATTAILAAVTTAYYYDCRVRREAL